MIGGMLRGGFAIMAIFSVNGPAPRHDPANEGGRVNGSEKAVRSPQPIEFPWCVPSRRAGLRACPRA